MAELGERTVESLDEEVDGDGVDAQRWLDLEDVETVSGGLNDDAEAEHAIAEFGTAPEGRIVTNDRGCIPVASTYTRVWREAWWCPRRDSNARHPL